MKLERALTPLLIVACVAVLAAATHAQDGNDEVRRMDELWNTRDKDPTLSKTLAHGTALSAADPNNFEVAWRMARATRWLTLKATADADKRRLALTAMKWAQRAIELRPDRVEGHFYEMMAVGEYGNTLSVARALYEGIGSRFEREGLKAYEIDRDFEDGEVLTALGRFYFVLPWPKRDLAKSRRFLEEGALKHPQILMNFVYLAELEYEEGNADAARAALERALKPAARVSRSEEQGEARALARAHLETWFPQEATQSPLPVP